MKNPYQSCPICFFLRPIMFGMTLGLGIGLATKNVGIGIAVGIVFAVVFGTFRRPTN